MKLNFIYKIISGVYDLIDVIYFKDYQNNPRKVVVDSISDGDSILDLCTGTATNAINIAKEKENSEIIGVDLSAEMLKVAENKIKKENIENVKLYQMDATNLSFESEHFDKILLSLVLHELDESLAVKIINEAKRVLKDNGEIIITEWEPSKQPLRKLLFAPIHFFEPKTYRKFIKKDLYSYFKKFGLKINSYNHCDYTKVITLKKLSEV